jgi:hypothetical protein
MDTTLTTILEALPPNSLTATSAARTALWRHSSATQELLSPSSPIVVNSAYEFNESQLSGTPHQPPSIEAIVESVLAGAGGADGTRGGKSSNGMEKFQTSFDDDYPRSPGGHNQYYNDHHNYHQYRGGSWYSDSEHSLVFLTETWMHQIIKSVERLSPWRSRIFFLMYSGSFIPSNSISVNAVAITFAALPPDQIRKFHEMGLETPKDIVKIIRMSATLNAFFVLVLLLSVVLLCIASVRDIVDVPSDRLIIFVLEGICIVVFTVELTLEFICVRTSLRESFKAFVQYCKIKLQGLGVGGIKSDKALTANIGMTNVREAMESPDKTRGTWKWIVLDVMATMPYYTELIVAIAESSAANEGFEGTLYRLYGWDHLSSAMRGLRILRILRLLKVIQKSKKLRVMVKALVNSMEGIWLLLYSVPLIVVFFSVLLFHAEQSGSTLKDGVWYYTFDGSVSPFQNIPECVSFTFMKLN